MDISKETKETWNKLASLYEDKFMNMNLYNDAYDYVCNHLTIKNARLLEVGCGPGNITRYLLSKRPDFRIHGIDYAPDMIRFAQQNNPTATFEVMDCRDIHQLTTRFNGIISGFCLPYLTTIEAAAFIDNAGQLLEERGLLYISFVEGDPKESGFQVGSTGDRIFFNFHTLDDIKKHLDKNRFTIATVFIIDYVNSKLEQETHTVVIATKD